MREILFRGKRVDNGEWVHGDLSQHKTGKKFIKCGSAIHSFKVITKTIGQYTGLNDKNYVRIFEGDIIKFGINQRLMYVHWNEETLTWELTDVGVPACEVNHLINTFDLGEIQVESAYGKMFSEVVGNIHDNPE